MKKKKKNRIKKAVRAYYYDLDIVRALACAAVLLYHLGVIGGGYLAVCSFFVLSGFLSVTSALQQKEFSVKKYYLRRLRQTYLPLAAVTLITVAVVSFFPDIVWLNLKPETRSVLLGYNNWWQLSASLDYFARHVNSPFMHFWYAAIQLQFDIAFPVLFVLIKKLRELEGNRLSYVILGAGTVVSASYMATLFAGGSVMQAYYDTFSRAHALLAGVLWGFIYSDREKSGKTRRIKNPDRQAFFWLFIFVWAGMMLFCSSDGSAVTMILSVPLSLGMIWAGTGSRGKKPYDRYFGFLSGMSYEIYLTQYPVIYFLQEMTGGTGIDETGTGSVSAERCVIAAAVTVITAALLKAAESFRISIAAKKKRAAAALCLLAVTVMSVFGAFKYAAAEDHTQEMKELEEQLAQIEAEMEQRQAEVLQRRQQEQQDWQEVLASFSDGKESLREAVRQLPVVGIGDSVMMGALPALYEQFPNGYFDTGTSRTSYVAEGILSSIESRGLLGDIVIINYGANGEGPERIRENIVDRLSGRKVFWITNTNKYMLWVNDSVKALAERKSNLRIVDWYEISRGHDEYFVADKIHLTSSGQKAFAQAVFEGIVEAYREEWQQKVDAVIAEHEAEERLKTAFYGNDLLKGAYPFLEGSFSDAETVVTSARGRELIELIRRAAESGEMPHRAVFVFDGEAGIGPESWTEIKEICGGHELYIVDTQGMLPEDGSAVIIDISDLDPRGEMYMPDRKHLSDKGSAELASRISAALPEDSGY